MIAGSLKGRRLAAPGWSGLRPTSDRLRETLFNVLAPRIAGARLLDLYAGTGAIGIEALSRGAARAVFVERDRRAQALVAENLTRCGISGAYAIIRATAARALATLVDQAAAFEIVVLDPPYAEPAGELARVLEQAARVLAPGGLVVLEHARRRAPPAAAGPLARTRMIGSGDSGLAFYELNS